MQLLSTVLLIFNAPRASIFKSLKRRNVNNIISLKLFRADFKGTFRLAIFSFNFKFLIIMHYYIVLLPLLKKYKKTSSQKYKLKIRIDYFDLTKYLEVSKTISLSMDNVFVVISYNGKYEIFSIIFYVPNVVDIPSI